MSSSSRGSGFVRAVVVAFEASIVNTALFELVCGTIIIVTAVLVDAISVRPLSGLVAVVTAVLVNTATVASIEGVVSFVAGMVSIVDSILVDIGAHILVGAIAVASNTTKAALLADIIEVLVAFAAIGS